MRWQKSLLFLGGNSAALGCVALLGMVLTDPPRLPGFWPALAALCGRWSELSLPAGALDPATWWTVCVIAVIDMLYLLWVYRQRRGRAGHFVNDAPLTSRRDLNPTAYEALLRQRHAALLARYQDPGLVQFLLNREAARAQRLDQWFEAADDCAARWRSTTPTDQKSREPASQPIDRRVLALRVEPAGV